MGKRIGQVNWNSYFFEKNLLERYLGGGFAGLNVREGAGIEGITTRNLRRKNWNHRFRAMNSSLSIQVPGGRLLGM